MHIIEVTRRKDDLVALDDDVLGEGPKGVRLSPAEDVETATTTSEGTSMPQKPPC